MSWLDWIDHVNRMSWLDWIDHVNRMSWLDWIDHVNRMNHKRKVSQVLNNVLQGSLLRGRPKNRWWNCVQMDSKWKITNWK